MVRRIVVILVVCTFVGAMMPARRAPATQTADAAKPVGKADWGSAAEPLPDHRSDAAAASASSSNASLSSSPLMLEREANGHFFADAQVNGATIHFLVDTGASGIALTVDDARRAGVPMTGMRSVVGRGASGPVTGQAVTIDHVRLGSREGRAVDALVIEGGDQSLLGQSFLAKYTSVEIKGDTMTLR
jgi:aspartyl protease family protein